MSASPQFSQLDMWKSAHELIHGISHGDLNDYDRDATAMWAGKRSENQLSEYTGTGVSVADVRQNGVQKPIAVWHNRDRQILNDGHHRAIAAYDANPGMMVPVEHEWSGLKERPMLPKRT